VVGRTSLVVDSYTGEVEVALAAQLVLAQEVVIRLVHPI